MIGRRFTLHLDDRDNAANRGKPKYVTQAVLFAHVGEEQPEAGARWKNIGMTSRARLTLTLGEDYPPGSTVWLCAYWTSARGRQSPACTPTCIYLPPARFIPLPLDKAKRIAA